MKPSENRTIFSVEKIYPDRTRITWEYKTPFTLPNGQSRVSKLINKVPIIRDIQDDRASRRAKTTVKDIVLSNNFTHFITLTFDPKKITSRYDINLCKIRTERWLATQRRKYGAFGYVILPEHHKDGAIHFHALFEDYKGLLVDSKVKHDNKPVYNLPAWPYGFSTAKLIDVSEDSRQRVAHYITKYITKDMPTFSGKKRYWASQGLLRPEKFLNTLTQTAKQDILCDTDYEDQS